MVEKRTVKDVVGIYLVKALPEARTPDSARSPLISLTTGTMDSARLTGCSSIDTLWQSDRRPAFSAR